METFRTLIGPDQGVQTMAQLSFRAVILLVFGILCVRIAGRRTFSQSTPLDIIVALIVGANLSRVITGGAPFFPSVAATLALVIAHRALAMAAVRWPSAGRWLKSLPVVLVRDGVADARAMGRHGITQDDLKEGLRLQRLERMEDVHLATMERGGRISVIPRKAS
jgi:uncharacterized membrane protein YcaP (DUF421 family)